MKTTQTLLAAVILGTSLFTASQANAALESALGGQVLNDTDLNIAWVADANLAASNTFGLARNVNLSLGGNSIINSDGSMNWGGAQKWIGAMNAANYLGYSDWRLPYTTDTGTPGCNYSTNGTDCGYNSTGSEMSHLYYSELGNKGLKNTSGALQPGSGLTNKGPFTNFQSNTYWSGTEYVYNRNAWYFYMGTGYQNANNKNYNFYALAVRSGQVAAVPIPAAAWLLGSGLLGLIGVGRRRLALR